VPPIIVLQDWKERFTDYVLLTRHNLIEGGVWAEHLREMQRLKPGTLESLSAAENGTQRFVPIILNLLHRYRWMCRDLGLKTEPPAPHSRSPIIAAVLIACWTAGCSWHGDLTPDVPSFFGIATLVPFFLLFAWASGGNPFEDGMRPVALRQAIIDEFSQEQISLDLPPPKPS
jgi:hypothetical protein